MNSLVGRLIKWGNMSDIDHVQFVLPDGRRPAPRRQPDREITAL